MIPPEPRHFGLYKESKLRGLQRKGRLQCGKVYSTYLGRTVPKVCTVRFQVYFRIQWNNKTRKKIIIVNVQVMNGLK